MSDLKGSSGGQPNHVAAEATANANVQGGHLDHPHGQRGISSLGSIPTRGRRIGNTLALLGIAATGLAIWRYWPGNDPATIKPSLIKSIFVDGETQSRFKDKALVFWLLAGWAVMPSLWFLAELAWWSPYSEQLPDNITTQQLEVRKQRIEEFKYMQSLSRAIWVAVLAVLAVLFGVSISGAPAG